MFGLFPPKENPKSVIFNIALLITIFLIIFFTGLIVFKYYKSKREGNLEKFDESCSSLPKKAVCACSGDNCSTFFNECYANLKNYKSVYYGICSTDKSSHLEKIKKQNLLTCKNGEYLDQFFNCVKCPPKTPVRSGISQDKKDCKACDVGEQVTDDLSTCEQCPVDTFKFFSGWISKCSPCKKGTTTNNMKGSKTCFRKQSNHESSHNSKPNTGINTKSICKSGEYFDKSLLKCVQCPSHKPVSNGKGVSVKSCQSCKPGTAPNSFFSKCNKCPVDTYSHGKGMPCKPCDKNMHTNSTEGAPECVELENQASHCRINQYIDKNNNCMDCTDYEPIFDHKQKKCVGCKLGEQLNTKMNICEKCPVNTYSNSYGGQLPCLICPKGMYTNSRGNTKCRLK